MTLKNTSNNYGTIAKWLHWGAALLFLGSYASVKYRHWVTEPRTPENWTALQLHLSIGITIGVVALLRILWRHADKPPVLEPGNPAQQAAARLGHLALYAVMILMPLSGYLGTGAATEYFSLFDIPAFKDTALFTGLIGHYVSFEAFEHPIDFFHKEIMGEWLVWLLILGHASAALYHHFALGDRTLRKMAIGR